jgi:hypothetical protein
LVSASSKRHKAWGAKGWLYWVRMTCHIYMYTKHIKIHTRVYIYNTILNTYMLICVYIYKTHDYKHISSVPFSNHGIIL